MVRTSPRRLLIYPVSFCHSFQRVPDPKRALQTTELWLRRADTVGASLQSAMTILELFSRPLKCSEDSMFTEDDILPVVECWAGFVVAGASKAKKERKLAMLMEAGQAVPAPRPWVSSSELPTLASVQLID